MGLFKKKSSKDVFLVKAHWLTQLLFFMPLLVFILPLRSLSVFANRADWQIYSWGLLFFTLLAVHGASQPILRITPSQLIFYQTQKRFWVCAWQDITQVEKVKKSLKFTTTNGKAMLSPPLGRRQRRQLLGILALHNIPLKT